VASSHDLVALVRREESAPTARVAEDAAPGGSIVRRWRFLAAIPRRSWPLLDAMHASDSRQQAGLAYGASLRILRFHVQNDFGDWNTVHHAFTAANALHQALVRAPTPDLMRGLVHGALRVYLDRFLNVPAARLPTSDSGDLGELAECWEVQGRVDDAGRIAYGYLRAGGSQAELLRRSVTHCWPRTPSSTGSRCSRRRCVKSRRGPRDPKKPR
jgi:hypothetical protein